MCQLQGVANETCQQSTVEQLQRENLSDFEERDRGSEALPSWVVGEEGGSGRRLAGGAAIRIRLDADFFCCFLMKLECDGKLFRQRCSCKWDNLRL